MSLFTVLQVLRRRIWILALTFIATLAGAIAVLLVIPPRYDAVATAAMDPSVSDPVSGQASGGQMLGVIQGNLMALAKSTQVALAVVKNLKLDEDAGSRARYYASGQAGLLDIQHYLANQFLDRVDARFGVGSNVLTITYKGNSPQQSANMANAFMSAFIDSAISLKGAAAQKAADWYAPQIEKIRAELLASREKLDRYQADARLLAPTTAADSESEQLAAVTGELTRAKAELVAMQSQLSAPPPTAAASNDAQSIDLQALGALRSSLSNLDSEIATLQSQVGPNNPRLAEKLAARQSILKQIDVHVDEFRKKLKDRIATQTQKVATIEANYHTRVNQMIGVQAQRERLTMLTRDVAFYQEELDRALKISSTARLQSQLSFSNIATIDVATPPLAVAFPKKIVVMGLACAAGLGLGVLFTLIAEALDRRMRNPQDLEYITAAPLLGTMIDFRPKTASRLAPLKDMLRIGYRKKPAEAHG